MTRRVKLGLAAVVVSTGLVLTVPGALTPFDAPRGVATEIPREIPDDPPPPFPPHIDPPDNPPPMSPACPNCYI